jgi:hypothetical protein
MIRHARCFDLYYIENFGMAYTWTRAENPRHAVPRLTTEFELQ